MKTRQRCAAYRKIKTDSYDKQESSSDRMFLRFRILWFDFLIVLLDTGYHHWETWARKRPSLGKNYNGNLKHQGASEKPARSSPAADRNCGGRTRRLEAEFQRSWSVVRSTHFDIWNKLTFNSDMFGLRVTSIVFLMS